MIVNSCDVGEYWIVNPINREVTVYCFENKDISSNTTYRGSDSARSYIFPELSVELDRIFK